MIRIVIFFMNKTSFLTATTATKFLWHISGFKSTHKSDNMFLCKWKEVAKRVTHFLSLPVIFDSFRTPFGNLYKRIK